MEKIGKVIREYSDYPGVDLLSFYELTLFSFITGNADMHLKNFSLLTTAENEVMLAPGYDLLSTKLLIPEDTEELALPMNGKKAGSRRLTSMHLQRNWRLTQSVSGMCTKNSWQMSRQCSLSLIKASCLRP